VLKLSKASGIWRATSWQRSCSLADSSQERHRELTPAKDEEHADTSSHTCEDERSGPVLRSSKALEASRAGDVCHGELRPYKCPTCGKAFIQSKSLEIHMYTHTTGQSHECSFSGCTKRFSGSDTLITRSKTHEDPHSGRGNKQSVLAAPAAVIAIQDGMQPGAPDNATRQQSRGAAGSSRSCSGELDASDKETADAALELSPAGAVLMRRRLRLLRDRAGSAQESEESDAAGEDESGGEEEEEESSGEENSEHEEVEPRSGLMLNLFKVDGVWKAVPWQRQGSWT